MKVDFQEIPILYWLGKILTYFINYVRPRLEPKKNCEAMWINTKQRPLDVYYSIINHLLEYSSYTDWIKARVQSVFPFKIITPLDFKRMIPTLLWNKEILDENMTPQEMLIKYSKLINTSEKVNLILFICKGFNESL